VLPAYAADQNYPVKASPPIAVAPTPDWVGFYVGINGGFGWGSTNADLPLTPFTTDQTSNGWLFGGHAGYNWQSGSLVYGLEIDYDAANLTGSETEALIPGIPVSVASQTIATKIDALATGRGRLGYTVTPNILLYGTAGVAWGHESATYSVSVPIINAPTTRTAFANQFGWVAGLGGEYKLTNNLLLRAEALHYDFGDVGYAFTPGVFVVNAKTTVDVVRGGITLKLN
jgi:opacity protein-like surface antigen